MAKSRFFAVEAERNVGPGLPATAPRLAARARLACGISANALPQPAGRFTGLNAPPPRTQNHRQSTTNHRQGADAP